MNITNNISPAFKGFYVHDENMSKTQKGISNAIIDAISYSDEYQKANENNIDVYITPNKTKNSVNVRYMDKDNGYYFRNSNDNRRIVQTTVPTGSVLSLADKITSQLGDILSGKFGFRGHDNKMFENTNSDLAKIRPELYED